MFKSVLARDFLQYVQLIKDSEMIESPTKLFKAELNWLERPDGWNGVVPNIILEWSK